MFDVKSSSYVVVLGNEKGGAGKTTTAMHIATALLRFGFTVGTLDLDVRQRSFSHYVRNRARMAQETGVPLPMPEHFPFRPQGADPYPLVSAIEALSSRNDYIVIDCPGSETPLVRMAHTQANVVVTPINDSFIDLDLIANLDDKGNIEAPGVYAEMVAEQRRKRMESLHREQEWVVVRNRLSHIGDGNKRSLANRLEHLSKLLDFRVADGLSERVVYRQLFLAGLTVLDLHEPAFAIAETQSHVTAREEVRALLLAIGPRVPADLELNTLSP